MSDKMVPRLLMSGSNLLHGLKCINAGAPRDNPATTGPNPFSASLWNLEAKLNQTDRNYIKETVSHTAIFCLHIYAHDNTSLNSVWIFKACWSLDWMRSRALDTTGAFSKGIVLSAPPTYCGVSARAWLMLWVWLADLVWGTRLNQVYQSVFWKL